VLIRFAPLLAPTAPVAAGVLAAVATLTVSWPRW